MSYLRPRPIQTIFEDSFVQMLFEACLFSIQILHGFANGSACMKRVSIPHQKLLRSLVGIFVRVAIGDVCSGAYTLARSVVYLFVGDIGIRPLAPTTYGWLRLRL